MIEQALESFRQEANADHPENRVVVDEILVREGNITDEIIEQAEATRSDMIVMAYNARNMVAEVMKNGIIRKVWRGSKKPVLLVPTPTDQ